MVISVTGITGNMGKQTLFHLCNMADNIDELRLLILPCDKRIKTVKKQVKSIKNKVKIIIGSLNEKETCKKLVNGADYVINLASVIPPSSDKHPRSATKCNQHGVDTLVSCIEIAERQPKYIHISTVALYGNRNYRHHWGRVGDPLLVSPLDIYSATKLRGEFRVLESKINTWVVLRQTAMLHENMLSDNMSDGLMFHTCFNAPLEWATAYDSGLLIANIIKKDSGCDLSNIFWKKVFNIGGGSLNMVTGFDTLNDGFKLIGGGAKDYFKPTYNAARNFHGVWFYDGGLLNDLFNYQTQSVSDYWAQMKETHKIYALARIVPKKLIAKFAIQRLFKDSNSPAYWKKNGDTAKLTAFFGSEKQYDSVTSDWSKFPLLAEGRTENGSIDYNSLKNRSNAALLDLGFDYEKSDSEITLQDIQNVADMHGGKLLTGSYSGDIYQKMDWLTQDGEKFTASVYTVLRAGHWYSGIYEKNIWEFDRLSKKDKIFAQVWYDSHTQDEDYTYVLDDGFNAALGE
ncbi:MAG: GDP-mannose 4,6-dehydratase [Clostridia bacterium]|nr:GDP-mannose 4,6-dehydratase [Clostridia bacterium]